MNHGTHQRLDDGSCWIHWWTVDQPLSTMIYGSLPMDKPLVASRAHPDPLCACHQAVCKRRCGPCDLGWGVHCGARQGNTAAHGAVPARPEDGADGHGTDQLVRDDDQRITNILLWDDGYKLEFLPRLLRTNQTRMVDELVKITSQLLMMIDACSR